MLSHCIISVTSRLKNLSSDIEIADKRIKKMCAMVTMERWVTVYLLSFEKELVRYGAQDQEKKKPSDTHPENIMLWKFMQMECGFTVLMTSRDFFLMIVMTTMHNSSE